MSPLGPGQMRARRRPGVLLLIGLVRIFSALCLALPLSSLIAESGIGLRSEGDRVLFEEGGYFLLELLRVQGPKLAAVLQGLAPLALLGVVLNVASNAALLVALNLDGKLAARPWLGATLGLLPAFLLIGAGTALGQALLLGAAALIASALPAASVSPQAHAIAFAALVSCGVLAAGALGGYSDVTKATLVRYQGSLSDSLTGAAACLKRRPLATCFGWLPFGAIWLAAMAAAAWGTEALDVAKPGEIRVWAVFALHQSVVLLAVALRASWFARALRLTAVCARTNRAFSDTAARSVVPLGPMTHPPASPGA